MGSLQKSLRRAGRAARAPAVVGLVALALSPSSGFAQDAPPLLPGLQQRHPLDEAQVGRLLRGELRCGACHDGLGEPAPAPRLDTVAARLSPDHLRRFLADPRGTRPGTTMPDVLGEADPRRRVQIAEALGAYLRSRARTPATSFGEGEPSADQGRELFHRIGCLACHRSPEPGGPSSGIGLEHVAAKYGSEALAAFLFAPLDSRPAGRMPDMRLARSEARDLAAYLRRGAQEPAPAPPSADAALVDEGRELFDLYHCAACHELEGHEPPLRLAPMPAGSSGGCLSPQPAGPPCYDLDDDQRSALLADLADPAAEASPEERVAATLTALNCIACHQRDDYGGVSAELDDFFTTAEPNLGNEARIPPQLTHTGAKLRPAWMHQVLLDGATVRPYMHTRMPQFGETALGPLPALLDAVDQLDPIDIVEPEGEARNAARQAGNQLLGNKGFNCIACHDYNSKPSPGFQGLDLIGSFERLEPEWFVPYLRKPQRFRPGTVMPSYWPAGDDPSFPEILDGDSQAQIEAIWFTLSLGRSAPDPSGIRREGSRLKVGDTTRTYRGRSRIAGFRGIAVGFPGGLNYAYDAETGALSGLWRGEFINVNWSGQGAGDFSPAARAVSLERPLAFARLAGDDAPWPRRPVLDPQEPENPDPLYPRRLGFRFDGYFFDEDWVPTFLLRSEDVSIEDRFEAELSGARPVLRRRLRLETERAQTLALRLLGGAIRRTAADRFETDDLRLHTEGARPLLRPDPSSPDQSELLLVIELSAGTTELRIDHELLR